MAILRNDFYKDNYRKLVIICFVLLAIIFGLCGTIYYKEITKPIPKYFVTTTDGKLIEISPVKEG